MAISKCTIGGCDSNVNGRGLCQRHYASWWRYGDPLAARTRVSTEERFWRQVEKGAGDDDCWLWVRATTSQGRYGYFKWQNRSWQAHRAAWTLTHGPIPDGLVVCHRCDVTLCVRPDHLFLGTQADNVRDMWEKGRGYVPSLGRVSA